MRQTEESPAHVSIQDIDHNGEIGRYTVKAKAFDFDFGFSGKNPEEITVLGKARVEIVYEGRHYHITTGGLLSPRYLFLDSNGKPRQITKLEEAEEEMKNPSENRSYRAVLIHKLLYLKHCRLPERILAGDFLQKVFEPVDDKVWSAYRRLQNKHPNLAELITAQKEGEVIEEIRALSPIVTGI